MLIKDLPPSWPPAVSESRSLSVTSDLGDVVVSVQNKATDKLIVKLRKNNERGTEYAVTLTVPENTLQKTLFSIITKNGTTLCEVGEIDVAESGPSPSDEPEIQNKSEKSFFPYLFHLINDSAPSKVALIKAVCRVSLSSRITAHRNG